MVDNDRKKIRESIFDDLQQQARDKFIAERRVDNLVQDRFEGTGLSDEITARYNRGVVEVEPDNFLDNDDFDVFRDTVRRFTSFERTMKGGRNTVRPQNVEEDLPPNPVDVHESRSNYERKQDEARLARLTQDVELYAKYPNKFDFPGVDTPSDAKASKPQTIAGIRNLFR